MSALPADDSPLTRRTQQLATGDGAEAYTNGLMPSDDADGRGAGRSASTSSTKVDPAATIPSRSGTLKKKSSVRKRASLSRRGSMKSLRVGSLRNTGEGDDDGFNNVFQTPIPTQGNPTDVLANRFQAWRKLLKDLITYFREIQASYETRSKALVKVSNVINATQTPNMFLSQGGLDEALTTLRGFHKISVTEANKSKDIEDDVIVQLNGLRSDLTQKIKEIKSLAGDFKNSVEKEKENTRKAVEQLRDALATAENDPASASGKGDPFIVRLAVDRQVEKQIEEENYLHRAYLNLEGSGRELESIVVGEIQKAYNAYVGILRRESDHAHEAIDELRAGPIAMPKELEWMHFVQHDDHFINPDIPLRRIEDVYYPGKFSMASTEIRAGMLERKSKYLKSYTPGWYVLSPTHLHEFKSADHIHTQQPVMSLFLLDQKLGSHSQDGGSSHKFSLKGRQTGAMHRGHSWVFRAESFDTMLAWYEDIRILTEKSGAERTAFVRQHARSVSGGTNRPASVSSDGLGEDEADAAPYAANALRQEASTAPPKRPSPGGRFPSEINVNERLRSAPLSPSSGSSDFRDDPLSGHPSMGNAYLGPSQTDGALRGDTSPPSVASPAAVVAPSALEPAPVADTNRGVAASIAQPAVRTPASPAQAALSNSSPSLSHTAGGDSTNDIVPALTAVGGVAGGAAGMAAYKTHQDEPSQQDQALDRSLTPEVPSDSLGRAETPPVLPPEAAVFIPKPEELPQPSPDTREPSFPVLDGSPAYTHEPSSLLSPTQHEADATSIASAATDDTIEPNPQQAALEAAGLHRTGHMFPSVLRHDTTTSVSELHVPGEFPPPTPSE